MRVRWWSFGVVGVFWIGLQSCGGAPCRWEKRGDGVEQITCQGTDYTWKSGANGTEGKDGLVGEKGTQGVQGAQGAANCTFTAAAQDPRTGVLRCKGFDQKERQSFIVLNGEVLSAEKTCRFESKDLGGGCEQVIVRCLHDGAEQSFVVGGGVCHFFEIAEVSTPSSDGKVLNVLRSGTATRTGEQLVLERYYRLRIGQKIGASYEANPVELKTYSNVNCNKDKECNAQYCQELEEKGTYDISCAQQPCAGQETICLQSNKLCYERREKGGLVCRQDSDCLEEGKAAERFFCERASGVCYRRQVSVEKRRYCELTRAQFEHECAFYPFPRHELVKGEEQPRGRCVVFRFSGRFRKKETASTEIIYERMFPGNSFCGWVRTTQTLFYPNEPERNRAIWESLDKRSGADPRYELSGYVDFVDGSRQFFRFDLYASADEVIQRCYCPEGTVFDPENNQCR
ncbi:hypothetical protein L6R29_05645 [Myxococcota bacterium]|nr:hypothetical protein [Myxococcota bacterium]